MEQEPAPATFAVKWQIERGRDADGHGLVGLTFTPINGEPVRVMLLWSEAERFSAALAEDVRANDPYRESRERYRPVD